MLRVLIVSNTGETAVQLKDRLDKTLPSNEYDTSRLSEFTSICQDYDVVLTFESLYQYVMKALNDSGIECKVKTIEGFNTFAKEMMIHYLKD